MKRFTLAAAAALASAVPALALPTFSPSNADYLKLVYVDFIDNAAPDAAAIDSVVAAPGGGVNITFDTDFDINDNLYRVAAETPPLDPFDPLVGFSADLTGFDRFSITLTNPSNLPLFGQLFLRSAGGSSFVNSGSLPLSQNTPITLSIPKTAIVSAGGDPADITSFGIEFFGGDEFLGGFQNAVVKATTTPQPPTLASTLLYDFEGNLDGWGAAFNPGHTHETTTVGATQGTGAMKITRNVVPAGFTWGTGRDTNGATGTSVTGDYNNDNSVNAADYTAWRDNNGTSATLPNDSTPGTVTQADYTAWQTNYGQQGNLGAELAQLVSLINDPNVYSVAFDLTIDDQFPNPNPPWFQTFLAIAADDGDDGSPDYFYQAPQFNVPLGDLGAGPTTVEVEYLLSTFRDANNANAPFNGIGANPSYANFFLATNSGAENVVFSIDNFRIKRVVPPTAIPEPTAALLMIAGLGAIARRRG
ncbi:MAG: hypothetical protein ACRCT8_05225 [Lacipirellulaceae bacterium]